MSPEEFDNSKVYASYVSRLRPDEVHSALPRDVISRVGDYFEQYASLSAFITKCEQTDMGATSMGLSV